MPNISEDRNQVKNIENNNFLDNLFNMQYFKESHFIVQFSWQSCYQARAKRVRPQGARIERGLLTN